MAYSVITEGNNLEILVAFCRPNMSTKTVDTGTKFYSYGSAPKTAMKLTAEPVLKESDETAPDGGATEASVTGTNVTGDMTLAFRPYVLHNDLAWISAMRAGTVEDNISAAVYTNATGQIDFSSVVSKPSITDRGTVVFYTCDDAEWDDKHFVLVSTATADIYKVYPPPATDKTFAPSGTPQLIPTLSQGGWMYPNASMADFETAGTGALSVTGAVLTASPPEIDFTGVAAGDIPHGIQSGMKYSLLGTASKTNDGAYTLTATATDGVYSMSPAPADETLGASGTLHGEWLRDRQTSQKMHFLVWDKNLNTREYYLWCDVVTFENAQPLKDVETLKLTLAGQYKTEKENGDTFGEVLVYPEKTFIKFPTGLDPLDEARRSDGLLVIEGVDKVSSCTLQTSSVKIDRTVEQREAQKIYGSCGSSDTDYKVGFTFVAFRENLDWEKMALSREKRSIFCTTRNMAGDDIWYGYYSPLFTVDKPDMSLQQGNPTITAECTAQYSTTILSRLGLGRFRDYDPLA